MLCVLWMGIFVEIHFNHIKTIQGKSLLKLIINLQTAKQVTCQDEVPFASQQIGHQNGHTTILFFHLCVYPYLLNLFVDERKEF